MPQIKIENLKVTYKHMNKQIIALNDFNAVFASGKFNVIIGYSGCGKTSLLKAIAGLIPYEGKIFIGDNDAEEFTVAERNLSYVAQNYILYPNKTIFDNIAFPLINMGADTKEITERVYEIAEKLGITCCLTRKPKHISGGQQQRAALARALVKHPVMCLLDEPLSNLDVNQRIAARQLIKKTAIAYSTTVIYVTHDFSEAMTLADELFVVDNGKIIIYGKPYDIYNSGNEIVNSLKTKENLPW